MRIIKVITVLVRADHLFRLVVMSMGSDRHNSSSDNSLPPGENISNQEII